MFLATLLLVLQPGGPAPDPRLDCAPVRNMTAAGPPPPVFNAQRMEVAPEARVYLSVHRCPGTGFRVERHLAGPQGASRGDVEWVPVSQCAALGGWIEATTRLRLPSPMLRPHGTGASPQRGTWFTLHAPALAGVGTAWNLELEILDPPGAPLNALGAWFTDGERLFQLCRDQGHGGTGYLPRHMGIRR
jgi:hypothetical protein